MSLALLATLLVQLTLGAATRHLEAGLAIPDFPLAYGQIIPPFDQAGIIEATDQIVPDEAMPQPDYFTPAQVAIHYTHRVWAVVVVVFAGALIWRIWTAAGSTLLTAPAAILAVLLMTQIILGISVITSLRQTEIATAHQAVGAATLATAVWLAIRVHLVDTIDQPDRQPAAALAAGGHLA